MESIVTNWQVMSFAAGCLGMGYVFGWARGKYGTISGALSALKRFVKGRV